MASSATVTLLGMMHMRPLQYWLHAQVQRWAWGHGTHRVTITLGFCHMFSPWMDLGFLWAGVPLEQSRCIVVTTDVSKTAWGAMQRACSFKVLDGPQLYWHINCLELLAVILDLRRFQPLIQGKHVLIRIETTGTIAFISHLGDIRSHHVTTHPPPHPLEV